MQTLYYNTDHYMRHQDNIVDLSEYRLRAALARQPEAGGLPPLPRRKRKPSLRVRLGDLLGMSGVVTTLAVTGALLTAM